MKVTTDQQYEMEVMTEMTSNQCAEVWHKNDTCSYPRVEYDVFRL